MPQPFRSMRTLLYTSNVLFMAFPSIYNLLVVPKEEVPELNYLNYTWIDFPLYQVPEDHEASIERDPGAPDPESRANAKLQFLAVTH